MSQIDDRKAGWDSRREDLEHIEFYDEVQTEQITKFIETVDNVTTAENVFKLQFSFYDGRKIEKTWTEEQWVAFKETEVYALREHITFIK